MARTAKVNDEYSVEWADKGEYAIRFADDLFDVDNPALAELLKGPDGADARVMLVADTNVVHRTEALGTRIGRYVQAHGIQLAGNAVLLGGGEKIKTDSMQSVMRVASAALDAKIGVNDAVLAIGGGAVLDVAGYATAQVRGGVRIVRVPTTPAAMVDAAFAETAAIDAQGVKDALRVPCRPGAVAIDVSFVKTVLDGVWRGGIGEIMRHAAAKDSALAKKVAASADALRARDFDAMKELIKLCVHSRVKKGTSPLALWSAMRLESMSGYKLPHGYAVPIGLCVDGAYAVAKGEMKRGDFDFVRGVLEECGALDGLPHSHHLFTQIDSILFGLDAWAISAGTAEIAIPSGVGKTTTDSAPDRELYRQVLEDIRDAPQESN